MFKNKLTILRIIIAALVGLVLFCYLLLYIPSVQNKLAQYIAQRFSNTIGTEVKLGKVGFSLFNKLDMENVLIRDQHKDTLLFTKSLKLRITDLLFSDSVPTIRYIGLSGTQIYLHRSSAVWNYQFILDKFKTDSTKKESNQLEIKKIDLSNFHFITDDAWIGEKMELKAMNILANIHSLKNGEILIDQVIANKPDYLILSKKGLRPIARKNKEPKRAIGSLYFNPGNLVVKANEIKIIKGNFWIEYEFNKPLPYFDGEHIRMHDLNATIKNASFIEDTIKGEVQASVKERSGFEIKKLVTHFRMTPEIMELDKLKLVTNKSSIGPYYAMHYKEFANDFRHYISNVTMKAHFSNATIASDDIAYFAPELSSLHQKINTSFHFNGTVEEFEAKELVARYNNSFVSGNFSMHGIPEMRNTQIRFGNVVAKTNYTDLANWIPSIGKIKNFPFESLGELNFKGDFNGTLYDFVTKGVIGTKMGLAETEIRLKLPANSEPTYEGLLNAYHFNAGKLFNIKTLGLLNFKGKIAGTSFSVDKIKTNIEGSLDSIEFNNYTYTNIQTDGIIQKGAFNGALRIKDPNINFISNIELNFNKAKPSINAVGDLINANLKQLNISKNPIQLTGLLDVNFEGDSIDNFIGFGKFFNGKLKGNAATVNFDSLTVLSTFEKGSKKISIASDDLQASIEGKFNILSLPASAQYFMQRYFPTYIPAPKTKPSNQLFKIAIKTNYFEPYVRLFYTNFSGFNNIDVSGTINTNNQNFTLIGKLPFVSWDDYAIRDGLFNGKGTMDSLHLNVVSKSFNITDSISFLQPVINLNTSNDITKIDINAVSKSVLEQVSLNGFINTYEDGVAIKWLPSYFILNQKKWNINNNGVLTLRKSNTSASNVKFTQGIQEFIFSSSNSNKDAIALELKNVIIGDITKLFFSYPKLEGVTNGNILFKNIFKDFEFNSKVNIDQLSFNNDSVGNTQLSASYIHSKATIPFSFFTNNEKYKLNANGTYNLKDTANPLDANLYLNNSSFGIVQQFIGGVLTNLEGQATGQLHFGGSIEHPYLLGKASIHNASFKVDYTKVTYAIDSATIRFTEEGIDFGSIVVNDALNRKAVFKGKILNQGFKHLYYDMEMSSPKIELLKTDILDNSNFYGHAVGKAGMTIKGPEENIRMSIIADVNDSSHIYLPNTTSKESGTSDFIVFKKYGKTAIKSADIPTYNLVVDLEVTANNKTQIDVIMDELTGDVIKGVGNGRIKIRAGNIEPLTIRGKYNIERGKYDFNFQSFIKKPFELIPEAGNFIEWTGDPLDANIHIDARYTAERVSLNELASSGNFSNAVRTYRGSVYVIAALRDKLSQPSIKFTLAFPQGNPMSSDNEFSQFISRLERDDNEILKQVSFLIVFNSFAPVGFSNANTNNAYNVTSLGINTISQLLTKEINKSLTSLLNKVTGDNSLRFDVGSSVYNSGNLLDPTGSGIAINANKIDRQRVNLKLGRSFMNDKIIVNIGGDLDFNVRNTTTIQNGSFQWLPDVNVEFVLTKNRKLRAILFNRNSLDINGSTLGRRNRQGVSISYRQDFDDFIF